MWAPGDTLMTTNDDDENMREFFERMGVDPNEPNDPSFDFSEQIRRQQAGAPIDELAARRVPFTERKADLVLADLAQQLADSPAEIRWRTLRAAIYHTVADVGIFHEHDCGPPDPRDACCCAALVVERGRGAILRPPGVSGWTLASVLAEMQRRGIS
jgi:hypothetical protein